MSSADPPQLSLRPAAATGRGGDRTMYRTLPLAGNLLALMLATGCSTFQNALAPALPLPANMPAVGEIADPALAALVDDGELIVLATPTELQTEYGIMTAAFQLGGKETWYDVKLVVDSVAKGKLKHAKWVDYGVMPAMFRPPAPFGRLAPNEIVVQFPAVNSRNSRWIAAPPLVPGERAVLIFKKCWNCVPITGRPTGRGPYYTANPWVAVGWGTKLPPQEWARVRRFASEKAATRQVARAANAALPPAGMGNALRSPASAEQAKPASPGTAASPQTGAPGEPGRAQSQ